VAYGQADLAFANVVRACPRVQKCDLATGCGASIQDLFGHVSQGWGSVRTLSLSGGDAPPLLRVSDAPALPLPLARLERLELLWGNVDTAMLEAAVNASPRLCALEIQEASYITSLENLASESLRSIVIDTLSALSGRLTLTGTARSPRIQCC
jgi:hypothetical protein